jgi:hypothetical protein
MTPLIRYIFAVPVILVGLVILGLHVYLFVTGVIRRQPVPRAIPAVNGLILIVGFGVLPVPSTIWIGVVLAVVDLALWLSVNKWRARS